MVYTISSLSFLFCKPSKRHDIDKGVKILIRRLADMGRYRAVMEIHLHFQNVDNEHKIREVNLNSEYYSGDFGIEYIKNHLLNDCGVLESTIKEVNIL